MTTTELQTYVSDHHGHELNFDSQEFIMCLDCDETFLLPEGSGVRIIEDQGHDELVIIEVPSGTPATRHSPAGRVDFTIELATGVVSI